MTNWWHASVNSQIQIRAETWINQQCPIPGKLLVTYSTLLKPFFQLTSGVPVKKLQLYSKQPQQCAVYSFYNRLEGASRVCAHFNPAQTQCHNHMHKLLAISLVTLQLFYYQCSITSVPSQWFHYNVQLQRQHSLMPFGHWRTTLQAVCQSLELAYHFLHCN